MSFSGTTIILNSTDLTAASTNSNPPYEFGWAKEGAIAVYCDNWGNVDNTLVIDVYWGAFKWGFFPSHANIIWTQDTGLTMTIAASGGATTDVAGVLAIPQIKGRFMKVVATLAGTTKEVDVVGYFYGKS